MQTTGFADGESFVLFTVVSYSINMSTLNSVVFVQNRSGCLAGGYGDLSLEPGMTLTPTQVQNAPAVSFSAEESAFYTLIMNDPDAPSRKDPKFGEYHHWLIMNIPGGAVEKGEVMSEYIGAGPPKDTGLHRYVFLVYKQKGKVDTSSLTKLSNRSPDARPKHSVRKFLKKHDLGELIAGNFFEAEYDDYVPVLLKQLGL